MEELLIQRQKRIAERSASTAKTAKNDKPKAELASRGMKRSNKPVIRSSTIDRLSAARVVNPKVLPTESKHGNKPTKVITKENGEPKPGKKPMKVATKENGESKPTKKPMKVTTKENGRSEPGKRPAKVLTKENGGSKPAKKPMKVFTKENGESKPPKKPMKVITKENGESKPPKKPMKVITKENGESKPPKTPMKVTTKNGISSTLFSQRTVGVGKREAKPQKVEHLDKDIGLKNSNGPKKKIVVLTNAKQLPRTSPIKKIGNGVAGIGLSEPPNYRSSQSDNKKGVSKTLHKKASSALQEDIALSGGNNGSTNKAKNSVSFSISEDISAKERRVVKANDEMMEISTPPPGKGSPERSNSRKKWSNIGTSSKALSGFRKLLSFGKRTRGEMSWNRCTWKRWYQDRRKARTGCNITYSSRKKSQLRYRRSCSKDDLVLGRFTENCPRNPNLLLIHKPSMEDAFILSVTKDLNGVTNVEDDGVRHAFCRHPSSAIEELEPGDHVVEYERECTHVCVSFNTEC
ncbi:hypothetical protein Ccrd_019488 [Cynara cardunculus var. scolymus]|uniref:Uncharacterized protein n=1 Tax=Cynara cardunculus var. scolymus TaxID=59895 RepID=A0A103Y460_CYNCS|nr:hypothetical protein Ccrd_019488 [Cynara cardunculus var. scolymus]